jgi:hypothetical protein
MSSKHQQVEIDIIAGHDCAFAQGVNNEADTIARFDSLEIAKNKFSWAISLILN